MHSEQDGAKIRTLGSSRDESGTPDESNDSTDVQDPTTGRYARAAQKYAEFVNPHVADLLERLRMDKCYVRGEGHLLVDAEGNHILDAVSGYGAVPFGHNCDWVWGAVRDFERSREPAIVQPSLLPGAGELAEVLLRHAPPGLRHVAFGNSGTEAVEAAIKACRVATRRLGIISTEGGFHGKTLGALSATGRDFFQTGSGAPVAGFRRVHYGDVDALAQVLRECAASTAAFIVEPIQGEGGVIEPPTDYLKAVRALCDKHDVLLIVDEVQTGLGRTGALFACLTEGITPDALTLSKALGGGLVPVSACLLSPKAYTKDFAFKHSSTFAGNGLAMRVGLRVVERLVSDREAVLENVVRQGAYLKRGLLEVQREYGSVIRDVRGRGLMLGVELEADRPSIQRGLGALLPMLGEGLALFAASYLLDVGRVRVAPTLNGTSVLRVQPPLTVTRDECDWIVRAFDDLASVMASGRSDRFVRHLLPPAEPIIRSSGFYPVRKPRVPAGTSPLAEREEPPDLPCGDGEEGRFAFIVHMLDGKSLSEYDRSLEGIAPSDLQDIAERFSDSAHPFVASRVRIQSLAGHAATGDFIILPKTTRQLLRLSPEDALEEVAEAVRLGIKGGAKIVGLGGYTSVVTQNLKALLKLGVPLTSGNSYTVVSAIDAALEASKIAGRPLGAARAVIVGGGGSIGSALASLLAERVPSLVLVGRDGDSTAVRSRYAVIVARMIRHAARRRRSGAELPKGSLGHALGHLPVATELLQRDGRLLLSDADQRLVLSQVSNVQLRWTTDLTSVLAQANLVILATSSPDELVKPEMVQPGTVICDLSRPANVSDALLRRQDVIVIDGGIVEVPRRPDLGFHFGLGHGLAYACMAETMMLALETRYEHTSLGRDLQESTLDMFAALAEKHGFRLAELRARQRPLQISATRRGSLAQRMRRGLRLAAR